MKTNIKKQQAEDDKAHENQMFGLEPILDSAIKELFDEQLRLQLEETCRHNLKRYECVACTRPRVQNISASWEMGCCHGAGITCAACN